MKLDDNSRNEVTKWLREYINDNCIYRVKPGEKRLPTQDPSIPQYMGYTNVILSRNGTLNGRFSYYVALLFWDLFAEKYKRQPFQISGLETGCISMMTAISMVAYNFGIEDLNCFYVRKEPRDYALKQEHEGQIVEGLPVLLVDDFHNSRQSFVRVKEYIEKKGLVLTNDAFTILNKQWEMYNNVPSEFRLKYKEASADLNIVSLFNYTDFEMNYVRYMLNKYDDSNNFAGVMK